MPLSTHDLTPNLPSTTPITASANPTSIFQLDTLFNNPLFAGGLGLAGLGAAAAFARSSAVRGAALIKRRLLVNLEIGKQDDSYVWIMRWLSLAREQNGFLASKLTRIHDLSMNTVTRTAPNDAVRKTFQLQPGYGRHIIRYKGAYIWVSRERQSTANLSTGEPFETVTLTTLYAHRHIFEDVFKECYDLQIQQEEGKTIMFKVDSFQWKPSGAPRRKRPLSSVILDEGIKDRVVEDVKEWIGSQQWYIDHGVPYRRGYLLYGPPGSGKSSFIQALAGELDFNLALINLSETGMTDDRLADLLSKLPRRTILLLEDADAAYANRRQKDSDGYAGATVTFSGLLNALDGVAAGEERMIFLTTNHIDRLDAALIRPGRVDMTVRIGDATRYQASEMWDRYYGDVDPESENRARFLAKLESLSLIEDADGVKQSSMGTSMAAIQGLFLFNKNNMEGAIAMAEGLIPKIYTPQGDARGVPTPA